MTILPTAFAIVHISLRQLYDTEPAMTSGAVALIHFGLAFCPRLYTSFSSSLSLSFFLCVCVCISEAASFPHKFVSTHCSSSV